ncbi:MAG: hypothetical protein LQ338_000172 [Usnochroma carphineum]|nr:MAG: hypothetical protein LQ338_000172 [Usnochroma carphineum]
MEEKVRLRRHTLGSPRVFPVHSMKAETDSSRNAHRKRDAASADLSQPGYIGKKQKTKSTNAQSQQPTARLTSQTLNKLMQQRTWPTKLRIKNPVRAPVPLDIWQKILSFCPLSCLLRIHDVSPDIKFLLTGNSLWRQVRKAEFGPNHPDPPSGMHEHEYAELLVGSECQEPGCQRSARKAWWAFRSRWCGQCLKKNTIQRKGCTTLLRQSPEAIRCIPSAEISNHHVYINVTDVKTKSSDYHIFSRQDIARIDKEFREAATVYGTDDVSSNPGLEAWVDQKVQANEELVTKLQAIEEWLQTANESACARRDDKSRFFAEKALLLDPPLELAELQKLTCFRRALTSKTEASDKSWIALEKKIQAELDEEVHQQPTKSKQLLTEGYTLCTSGRLPVQGKLLSLANEVVQNLLDPSTRVPPGDFVRIALVRVHKLYRDTKQRNDPPLVMDDARVVYINMIKPAIATIPDDAEPRDDTTSQRASQLRCAGCRRDRSQDPKQGDFEQLMQHVFDHHAGKGELFEDPIEKTPGRYGVVKRDKASLPWFQYPWLPFLPILASEQEILLGSRGWIPVPDLRAQPATPNIEGLEMGDDPGAFDNRVAATKGGPDDRNFVDNILYAASQFDGTSVDDKYVTKIALEYAVRKHKRVSSTRPDGEMLQQLQDALLREGRGGIFEGLRCRICCEGAPIWKKLGYLVRSGKPFAEVIEHYKTKHSRRSDWAHSMLQLPCAQDLLAHLSLPCNKVAVPIFEKLFPLKAKSTLDPRLEGGMTNGPDGQDPVEVVDVSSDEAWSSEEEPYIPPSRLKRRIATSTEE